MFWDPADIFMGPKLCVCVYTSELNWFNISPMHGRTLRRYIMWYYAQRSVVRYTIALQYTNWCLLYAICCYEKNDHSPPQNWLELPIPWLNTYHEVFIFRDLSSMLFPDSLQLGQAASNVRSISVTFMAKLIAINEGSFPPLWPPLTESGQIGINEA